MFKVFDPIAGLFCCLGVIFIVVAKALIIGWLAEQDMKFIRRARNEDDQ